ncbi:MAG TPA: hypothetical protein VGF55_26765 [Gemmataceae bacterium]|jgi:hypothetical protein
MNVVQSYGTTVADRDTGYSVTFLSFPGKYETPAIRGNDPTAKEAVVELLGLRALKPVRASELDRVIANMILAEEGEEGLQQVQATAVVAQVLQTPSPTPGAPAAPPDLLAFAEQVAYADLIPVEQSPLAAVSLAKLVATAKSAAGYAKNPLALGAFVGVLAGTVYPFLLVAVPAGMLLCGTTASIVKAIDARRDDILKKLFGIPAKRKSKAAAQPPPATQAGDKSDVPRGGADAEGE